MMKTLTITGLALAAAAMPVTASAATNFAGDTVTCSTNTFASSACNLNQSVVGGGATRETTVVTGSPEFFINIVPQNTGASNPLITADFENGMLTLQGIGQFSRLITGTTLSFTNTTKAWATVTHVSGLLAGKATITNGVLSINLAQTRWNQDASAVFNLSAVPEPGTWMLMILGLGAVGFAMRRRQNAAVRYQFA